jgi:hypothetical protein
MAVVGTEAHPSVGGVHSCSGDDDGDCDCDDGDCDCDDGDCDCDDGDCDDGDCDDGDCDCGNSGCGDDGGHDGGGEDGVGPAGVTWSVLIIMSFDGSPEDRAHVSKVRYLPVDRL